jgi:hypothetical protein
MRVVYGLKVFYSLHRSSTKLTLARETELRLPTSLRYSWPHWRKYTASAYGRFGRFLNWLVGQTRTCATGKQRRSCTDSWVWPRIGALAAHAAFGRRRVERRSQTEGGLLSALPHGRESRHERPRAGASPIAVTSGLPSIGAARERDVEAFKQGKLGRAYAGVPPAAAVMVDAGRILTRAAEQAPGVHEPQWRAPRYACCLSLNTKEQYPLQKSGGINS